MKCPKCETDNPSDSKYCKECATPLPSSKEIPITETLETPKEELTTGSTFAERYQIIEELGKGGMGRVYKAHDTKIKEKIALKLIKPEIAKDKKTIERFSNELRLARKIRHKNVCGMFDLGEEKGTHYITMEFVPGEDLKSLIKRIGQLPIGKSISITKQVCDGLAEAHRIGVVHRDLKSNNIMIDKEGNVRIMDFGIARSLEAKGITGAGVMIGTPEYMSPEQVEGKETDQRSDIYSLGVILYEMVTGQVPFEGDTPFTIGVKHKSEMPKNPKELNTQIPEELSRVILKCLEKDKEQRYQSADQVLSTLRNIEKGIPTTQKEIAQKKPMTSKEITLTLPAKKIYIPALIAIAIAIVGLFLWHPWSKEQILPSPTDKSTLAIVYFENNTGDESLEYLRSGLSEWLITDLNQSKYINVLSGDRIYGILQKLDLLDSEKYSTNDLKQVAHEGDATHVLKGSYIRVGKNFVITTMLQEAHSGDVVSSEKAECTGEDEIPAKVDELTQKIKSGLNLSQDQITSDIDRLVGNITTSSPDAYKLYLKAIEQQQKGEPRKSLEFLERAVEIDPGFALAYRRMANIYGNLYLLNERDKYIQKALELVDRISDQERYRIQGDYYRIQGLKSYDKAIESYRKSLELYPDSPVRNNFGVLYGYLEEWDEAIKIFEFILYRRKTSSIIPFWNMSYYYRAKGMYDKAKEVIDYYHSNFSENHALYSSLAYIYLCQSQYDLALAAAEKGLNVVPKNRSCLEAKGDIFHCKGEWSDAEEHYMKNLESREESTHLLGRASLGILFLSQGRADDARTQLRAELDLAEKLNEISRKAWIHRRLAEVNLKTGNPEDAIKDCDRALIYAEEANDIFRQIRTLHIKGISHLMMGSIEEAEKIAIELKELIGGTLYRKGMRYYYHLMGIINLKNKSYNVAIENLENAISLLPYQRGYSALPDRHALFLNYLALAYLKNGDVDKALKEYEKITSLTTGRLADGDIYAKAFYMLGKIYEQQGNTTKAIEHYEKFLNLWKDADPGIAEVGDAKERLAGLKE